MYCANAYSGTYMYEALTTDPTGLKFRAAFKECYSFYDIYTGNGYTLNPITGEAATYKELLYPNKFFRDFAQDAIVAVDLQIGANYLSAEVDAYCGTL